MRNLTLSRHVMVMACCLTALTSQTHADTLNLKYTDLRYSLLSASDGNMNPVALNDQGQVVGKIWQIKWTFDWTNFHWISEITRQVPVRWSSSGYPTMLPTSSGTYPDVTAVNSGGTVIGSVNSQAVLWSSGNKLSVVGPTDSGATDINDSGVIVGWTSVYDSALGKTTQSATRWNGSTNDNLQALLPSPNNSFSGRAVAINSQGSVAIDTGVDMSTGFQSCFLLQGTSVANLTAADASGCSVMGLADDNTVLTSQQRNITCTPDSQLNGTCYPLNYSVALWRNGQLTTLQSNTARYHLFRSGLLLRFDIYTATPGQGIYRIEADGTATPLTFNVTGMPTGYGVSDVVDVNRKGQYLVKLGKPTSTGLVTRWGILTP